MWQKYVEEINEKVKDKQESVSEVYQNKDDNEEFILFVTPEVDLSDFTAYVIKNGKYKIYYGLQFFEAFPNHDLLEKDYNLVYRKEYKMTREEAKEFFDEQKRQGASEHDILATLFSMFADDCIDEEELEELVGILGYELNAKFKELSIKDKKDKKRLGS